MYRYPPGRIVQEAPYSGGMLSAGRGMPVPALASSLANASPEEQRTVSLSRLNLMTLYSTRFLAYNIIFRHSGSSDSISAL